MNAKSRKILFKAIAMFLRYGSFLILSSLIFWVVRPLVWVLSYMFFLETLYPLIKNNGVMSSAIIYSLSVAIACVAYKKSPLVQTFTDLAYTWWTTPESELAKMKETTFLDERIDRELEKVDISHETLSGMTSTYLGQRLLQFLGPYYAILIIFFIIYFHEYTFNIRHLVLVFVPLVLRYILALVFFYEKITVSATSLEQRRMFLKRIIAWENIEDVSWEGGSFGTAGNNRPSKLYIRDRDGKKISINSWYKNFDRLEALISHCLKEKRGIRYADIVAGEESFFRNFDFYALFEVITGLAFLLAMMAFAVWCSINNFFL